MVFSQSDARSDIFSLGATLYEYRTGQPYKVDAPCEGPLGEIIAKCTRFDAAQRYQSVAELSKALAQLGMPPKKRWVRWLLSFLAGCLLALVLALPLRKTAPKAPPPDTAQPAAIGSALAALPAASSLTPVPSPTATPLPTPTPCICDLLLRPKDPRLGEYSLMEHPESIFLPSPDTFPEKVEFPVSLDIQVQLPVYDDICTAENHTHQSWEYSLNNLSTTGTARVDGDTITVYEPGSYYIDFYMPNFNGRAFGSTFCFNIN